MKYISLSTMLLSALLLVSCVDESIDGPGTNDSKNKGQVSLKLAAKESKAAMESVDDFIVTLKKSGTGEIVQTWPRYADMPDLVSLEVGTYTLEARNAADKPAAFEQPIYKGEQPLEVKASEISTVNVVCTQDNMKVSVSLDESFLKEVKGYQISVTTSTGHVLVFEDGETRNGYFEVAPLEIHIRGNREDGTLIEQTSFINDVAPRDHHRINLKAVETGSGGLTDIEIDYSTVDRDVEVEVPGVDEEDGPVVDPDPDPTPDPDPDPTPDPNTPTINGPGLVTPLNFDESSAEGAVVNIAIATKSGISELWVQIDSPALTEEALEMVGLPVSFDLANADETLTGQLKELGLLGDTPIKGTNEFTVAIGRFMPLLLMVQEPGSVTHKFHLTVKDTDGATATATLTVNCTK